MKVISAILLLGFFLNLSACGSRTIKTPINNTPSASASPSGDIKVDPIISADLSPSLETNDALVKEVTTLEAAGKLTNVLIKESFPVQISLTGPSSLVKKLQDIAAGKSTTGDNMISFDNISNKLISKIKEEKQLAISDEEAFKTLWKEHHGSDSDLPSIDFSKEIVLAVFMGRKPTAGFSIEISSVKKEGNTLLVHYTETEPPEDGFTAQALTAPYHLIKVTLDASSIQTFKFEKK